jgi:hypothetical protein
VIVRRMRWMLLAVLACGACGGNDKGGGGPPADAPLSVIDGVVIFPDAPMPDAVSATTGAIDVSISCGGPGCGKNGMLPVGVDDCQAGNPSLKTLFMKTLTAGQTIDTTFDSLKPGAYCVAAWLDVDMSGSTAPTKGDVTTTGEKAVMVTVVAGQSVPAAVTLDTIKP